MTNSQCQIANGDADHLPLTLDAMAQGKRPRARDIMADVGKRLRWAREVVADSQASLCRDLGGLDPTAWNRWERGNRYPDPIALIRFCDTFGLTMDYLYRGDLRGVREDVAFRLAAYHPELVDRAHPVEARRAKAAARVA